MNKTNISSHFDRIGVGSSILIFFAISLTAVAGLIWASRAQMNMIADRSTEFVETIHTGEHIILDCDRDKYLVLPVDSTPTEIGILLGSYSSGTNDIYRHEYHPGPEKQNTILIGCLKIEIVKDPESNWMLNIYRPPADK